MLRGSRLHVASVGDCRALLVSGEHTYQQLTTDQRASEPAERARILECGGEISADGRVWGSLIPSRTLGDFPWKDRDGGRALSSLPALCTATSMTHARAHQQQSRRYFLGVRFLLCPPHAQISRPRLGRALRRVAEPDHRPPHWPAQLWRTGALTTCFPTPKLSVTTHRPARLHAQRACNELVKEIKKRPGTDDTTVIVIHFERDRQRECSADKLFGAVRRSVTV